MLPVYRTSEGVENLENNYNTFEECKIIFKQNGIVLMFSEGNCINEWHLRPLKKGTARLSVSAWEEGIPLKVLPVGINYSSFRKFGKNVFINFGSVIKSDLVIENTDGKKFNAFNEVLKKELEHCVFEIDKNDIMAQQKLLIQQTGILKIILFFPAVAGWIIHAPVYYLLKAITIRNMRHPEFFDAILTALIVMTYPFFLIIFFVAVYSITGHLLSLFCFLVLPFFAWSYVQLKKQLDNT
jgi:hypothetical protein